MEQQENSATACASNHHTSDQQFTTATTKDHNNCNNQNYNSKKSVTFKKLVDIFQLSDAWQLHVKKSNLKTEEDQAKRRILQRNY